MLHINALLDPALPPSQYTSVGSCTDSNILECLIRSVSCFAHDISNGDINDLSISRGPPGYSAGWSKCKHSSFATISPDDTNPNDVEGC